MAKAKKTVLTVFFILAAAAASRAGSGGEPMAFLKNGLGVRAIGMGAAFTAVADDLSGVFYNPAGTIRLKDLQLMAESHFMSYGRSVGFISIGKPFALEENLYSISLSWLNASAGDDLEYRSTNSYEPERYFSDTSNIFLFNVSTVLSRDFAIGGNVKIFINNIDAARGTGVGFDLGFITEPFEDFRAGCGFSNISTNIAWDNGSEVENVPIVFNGGVSYVLSDLKGIKGFDIRAAADVLYTGFDVFKIKAGIEAGMRDFVFLRAGYNDTLSMGLGIILSPTEVFTVKCDYAFVPDTAEAGSGLNHRIGMKLDYIFPHFGRKVEDKHGNIVRPDEEDGESGAQEYEW
ncbi:MAG: hypothetical protein ACLFP1_03475 [Candidatus Goldiibacteriota bacterium]